MQRDFQNKTVVITGACRGIGAGIAERFARDGANLVMVSNAERVHETAETLRQRYQADILSLQVDVTDEARVQGLYEQAAARFGTIDVSIQNAGVITIDYYDRMPKADFEKVLAVNTTGVLPRGGQIYGETESRQPDQHLFRPGDRGLSTRRTTPPAKWA